MTFLLLDCGFDFEATDQHGKTALEWAKERGHSEVAELLEKVKELERKQQDYDLQASELQQQKKKVTALEEQLAAGAEKPEAAVALWRCKGTAVCSTV